MPRAKGQKDNPFNPRSRRQLTGQEKSKQQERAKATKEKNKREKEKEGEVQVPAPRAQRHVSNGGDVGDVPLLEAVGLLDVNARVTRWGSGCPRSGCT